MTLPLTSKQLKAAGTELDCPVLKRAHSMRLPPTVQIPLKNSEWHFHTAICAVMSRVKSPLSKPMFYMLTAQVVNFTKHLKDLGLAYRMVCDRPFF